MTQRIMKLGLALSALTMFQLTVVACAPGTGEGEGEGECSVDTDCEGDIARCRPDALICEDDCSAEGGAVCDGTEPVCAEDGDLSGHCVCDATSCDAGESCNDDTGYCEEVDGCVDDAGCEADEVCNIADAVCECDPVGAARDDGTVCGSDLTWQAECTDSDCYEVPAIELCQFDDTDASFNQCVSAELLTGDCTDGDAAPAQTGTTPTVTSIETLIAPAADACDDGAGNSLSVRSFLISVYSTVDLTGLTANDLINRANFGANDNFYVGDGTYDADVAYLGDTAAEFPGEYLVTAYICGNPSEAAAYVDISSDGGGVSNAYCFDPLAAP